MNGPVDLRTHPLVYKPAKMLGSENEWGIVIKIGKQIILKATYIDGCCIRVCQYVKVFLIGSSTSGSVNKKILRLIAFLFFQISFIFFSFSARKDCQKYMYFQHLYPVLVQIRFITFIEKNCYCFFYNFGNKWTIFTLLQLELASKMYELEYN